MTDPSTHTDPMTYRTGDTGVYRIEAMSARPPQPSVTCCRSTEFGRPTATRASHASREITSCGELSGWSHREQAFAKLAGGPWIDPAANIHQKSGTEKYDTGHIQFIACRVVSSAALGKDPPPFRDSRHEWSPYSAVGLR